MAKEKFNKYATQMGEKLHGLLSVNFVNIETGNLLHSVSFSQLNYEATAKFEAEIAKNALQAIKYIDTTDEALSEIIISNDEHTHFLYISDDFSYLIHLITDAKQINYALLQVSHTEYFQDLTQNVSEEILKKEPSISDLSYKKVKQFKQLFFN